MFIHDREDRPCVTAYVEDIARQLDKTMNRWTQYMNVATREFETLADGMYIEPDEELVERIAGNSDYFWPLNQHDIYKYIGG